MSKRPDEMTPLDEHEAYVAHKARAMQVARAMGYDSIIECARRRFGYVEAFTTLPPAEYVLAQWRLLKADEYYRALMAQARSQRQKDGIADAWQRATQRDEERVGA